jgi:hypothetical protein
MASYWGEKEDILRNQTICHAQKLYPDRLAAIHPS